MFVVEDGTGLTDSNSYVSVAEADGFHADRGNAAWTGTDQVKQTALVRATDYIEQAYAGRWRGEPLTDTQALSWPRSSPGISAKLKQAVCLLALETIAGTSLNPTQGRAIKRERVEGAVEVEYMDNAKAGPTRPAVDGLLAGLTAGASINAKAVRV